MNKAAPEAPAAQRCRFRRARRAALALAALAVLTALPAGAAAADAAVTGAPHAIAAPFYGDTLFHFYQDQTFTAITGLLASQHFGRIAPHDDEAEVLRGGMLLAYGMHNEAAALFARLIEGNAAPSVRDRAWYFLARVRHQRGLNDEAEAALARIEAPLVAAGAPPVGALEDERQLLVAQLLMERLDYAGAAAVLEALQARPGATPKAALYARFNLGVSLIKVGDAEHGIALLDALGQVPAADEEVRSLRDRANVALGYTALQANRPRDARDALQRVRLNGLQSNKALLGFGWAAAGLNDPRLALVPWTELAARSDGDAAVLEARIAVPYALGELGSYGNALRGYEQAALGFEHEQVALTESIAAIRAGKLAAGLLAQNPRPGLNAFYGIRELPEMPHAPHLVALFASDAFQESFKNLRDLQFLAGNLQQWQDKLGTYDDMLANRRRAYAERLPAVRASRASEDIAVLQQRRDALAAELAAAQAAADGAAYADPRERGLMQRIESARVRLAQVGADPADPAALEMAAAAERLRRAAGALDWQLAQQLPERNWQARKALRGADQALVDARRTEAALVQAQRDEPARQQAFAARIAALAQRIATLAPQVAAVSAEQQGQLQDIAVAELERQQQRLQIYAAQARLAMAQIHDRAQFARGDAASAPAAGSPGAPPPANAAGTPQ